MAVHYTKTGKRHSLRRPQFCKFCRRTEGNMEDQFMEDQFEEDGDKNECDFCGHKENNVEYGHCPQCCNSSYTLGTDCDFCKYCDFCQEFDL